MKQVRTRLESRWWKAPSDVNLAAVKKMSNKYCNPSQSAKRAFHARLICEASNQWAALYRMFCDLTDAEHNSSHLDEITCNHFAAQC